MRTAGAKKKRMLVVEDEPAICRVCSMTLASEGFEVDIAANGKIAQGMIEKKQYNLFLIDIRTPEMNGKELYKWLKGKHPQIVNRVIFTTGDVIRGDIQSFIEETGKPFLLKPFAPRELIAIIKEALK